MKSLKSVILEARSKKIGTDFKLTLTNNKGTRYDLGNLLFGLSMSYVKKYYSKIVNNTGGKDKIKVLNYIISNCNWDAQDICNKLSTCGMTYIGWKVDSQDSDMIRVSTEDFDKNVFVLVIKR